MGSLTTDDQRMARNRISCAIMSSQIFMSFECKEEGSDLRSFLSHPITLTSEHLFHTFTENFRQTPNIELPTMTGNQAHHRRTISQQCQLSDAAYTLAQVFTFESQLSRIEHVLLLKVFFRIW